MKSFVGEKAPFFSLSDQNGKQHALSDFLGQKVILYFYPKDDTPGCTKEACAFKTTFPEFQKVNTVVIGVSCDSEKSHKKFEEKFQLPFLLLSDDQKEVVKLYDVWGKKKFMGREYEGISRTTFLIDENGIVLKQYENVKPEIHADEILKDLL